MDEKRSGFSVKALGSSGAALRLPGRGYPGVDDRLVVPEVTRDEMVGGRRMVASPAEEPHASQQAELDYLLRAHVALGYKVAADMLTRHDEVSDFASDACVYREGVDPATGGRYLEEIAFEIVSVQRESSATEKALRMHRRGIRRVFAIWLKKQQVCEWSPETQGWRPLAEGSAIQDICLAAPLTVKALLNAAQADAEVFGVLVAKGIPAVREHDAAVKAEGRHEIVLALLERRYGALSAEARNKVEAIRSVEELTELASRAFAGASLAELGLVDRL